MTYQFNGNTTHTLGVEIELQLVDRATGQLVNRIEEVVERVPTSLQPYIKPEFMQSYCEVNTGVCDTVEQVERDLTDKLHWLNGLGERRSEAYLCCAHARHGRSRKTGRPRGGEEAGRGRQVHAAVHEYQQQDA